MSSAISQKDDLISQDKEALADRIIKLELFIRNLAQRYFAQDDFSRRMTAKEKNVPFDLELIVNGREAFVHWAKTEGPSRFAKQFEDTDAIMHAFTLDGVGEKPPPPD